VDGVGVGCADAVVAAPRTVVVDPPTARGSVVVVVAPPAFVVVVVNGVATEVLDVSDCAVVVEAVVDVKIAVVVVPIAPEQTR
jgi:hypothetical protein